MGKGGLAERFWGKVTPEPNTGCWLWTASHDRDGYGRIKISGRPVSAHRVAWELAHGEIPRDLETDHLCRNRACVNVAHLELVSHRTNVRRGALCFDGVREPDPSEMFETRSA